MSTGNPAPGVGGTAQDGGLSTAGALRLDLGKVYITETLYNRHCPRWRTRCQAGFYQPVPPTRRSVPRAKVGFFLICLAHRPADRLYVTASSYQGGAHTGNPAPGVGGTAKDGGLSTAGECDFGQHLTRAKLSNMAMQQPWKMEDRMILLQTPTTSHRCFAIDWQIGVPLETYESDVAY